MVIGSVILTYMQRYRKLQRRWDNIVQIMDCRLIKTCKEDNEELRQDSLFMLKVGKEQIVFFFM